MPVCQVSLRNNPSSSMFQRIVKAVITSPGLVGRILLGIAALISLYLASISLTNTHLAGCGEASSCHRVLSSRWGLVFGLPVSFVGLGVYCIALFSAGAVEARQHRTWSGLVGQISLLVIVLSGLWFLALQLFVLGSFCPWCTVAQICGITGALALLYSRSTQTSARMAAQDSAEAPFLHKDGLLMAVLGLAAILTIGALAAGPFIGAPVPAKAQSLGSAGMTVAQSTVTPADQGPVLSLHQGKIKFPITGLPRLGATTADEVALALVDYTCDFCRMYHETLVDLVNRRGPNFGVVLLPAHRTDDGGKLQELMLTLFRGNSETYEKISGLLYAGALPARSQAVLEMAAASLGVEKFQDLWHQHHTWAEAQVRMTRELQVANKAATGDGSLPQLIVGNRILIGYQKDMVALEDFVSGGVKASSEQPMVVKSVQSAPVAASAEPMLSLRKNFADVGEMKPGQHVTTKIEFQNLGRMPLKIDWVSLDYGCEVVSVPKDTIGPNSMAFLEVRIQAPETGELFEKRVRIHSNATSPSQFLIVGKLSATAPTPTASAENPGSSQTAQAHPARPAQP